VESLFGAGLQLRRLGAEQRHRLHQAQDWEERQGQDQGVEAVAGRAMGALWQIKDAMVFAFPPPAVFELGTSSGFDFYLKDLRGQGHDALTAARNQFLGLAAQSKLMRNVRPNGQEDTRLRVDVDTARAGALDLAIDDINDTLSLAWGGRYVDDCRPRPGQAGHPAGGRTLPHGAGGLQPLVGAQRERRNGALLRIRDVALGVRFAPPRAFRRHAGGRDQRRRGTRRQHGHRDGRDLAAGPAVAAGHRRRLDRPVVPERHRRGRRCIRCHCSSSSSASRPSTNGRSHLGAAGGAAGVLGAVLAMLRGLGRDIYFRWRC
jgi:hypothetical protein